MKVLVTGGNGFLGSHLVRALVDRSVPCLVLSRQSYRLENILERIEFIKVGEGYTEHIQQIHTFAPTHCVHFAWEGGNSYADIQSARQVSRNLPSTIELLEILASLPSPPHVIGVGSFAEYGILTHRAVETQDESPVSFYGIAKCMARRITERMCADARLPWTWIRPCYIYGPNDVSTRLFPRVLRSLQKLQNVELDSCNTVIDYLHVDDFSTAVLQILYTSSTGIFNICSGEEYCLRTLLLFLKDKTCSNVEIRFADQTDRVLTSTYICGDNSRLRMIGWEPHISIYDGLSLIAQASTLPTSESSPYPLV